MNISVKESGNAYILSPEGRIDSKTAPELEEGVFKIVKDAQNVVLDLTNVTFVSSAGLRVLLLAYRQLKSKNGKVILVGVSEEIREIMSMSGFISFFEIYDTVEDGLQNI